MALGEFRERVARRVADLPQGLQAHICRAEAIAVELAPLHGVDPQRAALGILAHDVARAMPDAELLRRAAACDLPIGLVERQVPLLLHGPVGAELLRREDGLGDADLYASVCWHTTGHPSLDALGKLVFLADKLDPQKRPRYPYQPQLLELARRDLDGAMLLFLTNETLSLVSQGQLLHPAMVKTRNHLLAARAQKPLARPIFERG